MFLIEPNINHFLDLLSQADLTPLIGDARIFWLLDSDGLQLDEILSRSHTALGSWGMNIYLYSPYKQEHAETMEQILVKSRNALESAQLNTRTQIERGFLIQHNILRNLPKILRSLPVNRLENTLSGFPAIVVGAGPSLNKNVRQLNHLPPNILLTAVDTALPVLLQQGIHPHIVVACDPTPLNHKHFAGIPSLGESILAFLPETYYGILEQFSHHTRLICLHDWESKTLQYLLRELGIRKTFRRGDNVGYCAFSLVRHLGCSPIILAGMDLAISPQGRSHAEGTRNVSDIQINSEHQSARFSGNVESQEIPIRIVDGYYGEPVITFPYFYQSLLLFERDVAEMKVPVIDATEGGAKKQGAIQMLLHEAIVTYQEKIHVKEQLENALSISHCAVSPTTIHRLQELKNDLQSSAHQLDRGIARLQAWIETARKGNCPDNEIPTVIHQFLQRWNDLLYSPALDQGMDIALARLRHETRCAEVPESLPIKEAAEWWHSKLAEWFEDLRKDLATFEQIYEYTLQQL